MMEISIFDTFKMSNQLTGKAKRQRKIIKIIGGSRVPDQRTKVEISKKVGIENEQSWKNSYSGVYEDIEKIFLPQRIIEEEGKIPVRRGPRLLQKEGTGYYKLTKIGKLLLFGIGDKIDIDFREYTDEPNLGADLNSLYETNQELCFLLIENYISMNCANREEILPIKSEKFSQTSSQKLTCDLDFLKSMLAISKEEQEKVLEILSRIDSKH